MFVRSVAAPAAAGAATIALGVALRGLVSRGRSRRVAAGPGPDDAGATVRTGDGHANKADTVLPSWPAIGLLAFAAAAITGEVAGKGWPADSIADAFTSLPIDVARLVPYAVVLSLLQHLIELGIRAVPAPRLARAAGVSLIRLMVAGGFVWLLTASRREYAWDASTTWRVTIGATLILAAHQAILAERLRRGMSMSAGRRAHPIFTGVSFGLLLGGSSWALFNSAAALSAGVAGSFGIAMGVLTLASAARPAILLSPGVGLAAANGIGVLWLAMYLYSDMKGLTPVLLAAAPAGLWVSRLPWLRRQPLVARAACEWTVVTAMVVGAAVGSGIGTSQDADPDYDPYGYGGYDGWSPDESD